MIGILGGSGAVGRVAVDRLVRAGVPVRVGGRDLERARAVAGDNEARQVDLIDDVSLAAFCADTQVVLNCAGPSYQVLDKVARVALAAGAGYVDAAGDLVAMEALRAAAPPQLADLPAVFSAGMMPGLTGLLPRLLADAGPVGRVDVFVGGSVPITALSAIDALLTRGPRFGHALALWRGGDVVEHALAPLNSVALPGFPGRVHAVPFLSTEMSALAPAIGADELRSHTVYVTENLQSALATAWAQPDVSMSEHVEAVVAAGDRDVAECGRYYTLLAQCRPPAGSGRRRQLLLRIGDSYALSGVFAAIAVQEMLDGRVPTGAHHAAEVLDARRVATRLADDELVHELELPTG